MTEDNELQEIVNSSLKENNGIINPNLLYQIAKNAYNKGLEDAADNVLIDDGKVPDTGEEFIFKIDRQSILKLKKK